MHLSPFVDLLMVLIDVGDEVKLSVAVRRLPCSPTPRMACCGLCSCFGSHRSLPSNPSTPVMVNLTVRNLTSSPLHLTHSSRFPELNTPKPEPISARNITDIGNLTHNFTSLLSPHHPPSNAQLVEHSKAYEERNTDVAIAPYTSHDSSSLLKPDDILRIEFTTGPDGSHKFRVDLPPTQKHPETVIHPLGNTGDTKLAGIFHRQRAHLAIVSASQLNAWMGKLADKTSITALSLPGTHNSPTHHTALPSVRCQAVGVRHQLDNGVRFLDVRVEPHDDGDLTLVHGVFPISLSGPKPLSRLLQHCYDFLTANPSECIVVSLKREGHGDTNDQTFSKLIKTHVIDKDPARWYTAPELPTLGQARGKCVLFRRYQIDDSLKHEHDNKGFGINAESWAYNCAECLCSNGHVCVQDFCEVLETENIDKKIEYVKAQLERSTEALAKAQKDHQTPPLFLNFLSASNFWKVGCWPDRIAAKINPAVVEWLAIDHKVVDGVMATGAVITDFVGEDGDYSMFRLIVGLNASVLMKQ